MTLWTEPRHQAIKSLQAKIRPHFDRINQLLTNEEDNFRFSSSKQLYSSPIGRRAASQRGPILETTPFGEILESTSVHDALKASFGPDAFGGSTHNSTGHIYKEINGSIIAMQKGSPEDEQTAQFLSFTTDPDTAVVIGVWEAVSSSFAQEAKEEAHIYVPFGIGSNTVAWNHELPELRKNFKEDQIIIHTLKDPEAYQELKADYNKKMSAFVTAQSNAYMPTEIVFFLRQQKDFAYEDMNNYLNEAQNWNQSSIDKSNVNIITRDKTSVSLQSMKGFVRKIRQQGSSKQPLSSKSSDEGLTDSDSSDDKSGSMTND